MCNLYSVTRSQEEIRRWFAVRHDRSGNLPSLPGVYPDSLAPVVRATPEGHELLMMRWGFPPPPDLGTRPITNARNLASGYWRDWLERRFRCVVPVTSFCEWTDRTPKVAHWFAPDEERPLFAFAGIWRPWRGLRGTKKAPVDGEHLLFSFLTTASNETVRPIHAKAMPVVLTTPEECTAWLEAPTNEALRLQRPAGPAVLRIVARGEKEDAQTPLLL
ncbi:MAG: SOS response-associated peptidase family protein [Rhizobiales bacterium]|nr:SOS response-associated peptidase family protein [Hyphomicrobiales bacterium]